MGLIDHDELERLEKFVSYTNYALKSDAINEEEFERDMLRMLDFIETYDGCVEKTIEAFNKAHNLAWQKSREIYDSEGLYHSLEGIPSEIYDEIMDVYLRVLTDNFFAKYIQFKWKQLNEYKKQTSTIDPVLYQDYQHAQDVASYAEFGPPFRA
ncbi:hypothetical protein [Croceimicrobium sp.]|uniref:hypothetical protein n=1 Tax=Croceimicrobium sp. TaxID=2828340 RepID=UPI003BAC2412